MIKIAGAVLVMLGATFIGFSKSRSLREYSQTLTELAAALRLISAELEFKLSPLGTAFFHVSEGIGGHTADFFKSCGRRLAIEPANFSEIWKEELKVAGFDEKIKEIMEELSDVLGRYTVEEQSAALGYAEKRLLYMYTEFEKKRADTGKIYMTLGISVGAVAVIMLI